MARAPAPILAQAVLATAAGRLRSEWFGTPFHRLALRAPRPRGLAARPRDLRPPDAERGARILEGDWAFTGQLMRLGRGADPWDRACPGRAFAVALHRMDWLADLMAAGDPGRAEALRLVLEWRRAFGGWNAFSWSAEPLERRVVALACAAPGLTAIASEAETGLILGSLLRQARHLLLVADNPARAADRAAAAAIAAAALSGPAAERLLRRALARLERRLPEAVLPDGGHATRSPEAGLELLFDLHCLDDVLSQRGRAPPVELSRAVDRLTGAVRFLTLADGRLAQMQGGRAVGPERIAAALAHDDEDRGIPASLRDAGYHRLEGGLLQVFVDAAPPAQGPWSLAACVSPGALEIVARGKRLVVGALGRSCAEASMAAIEAAGAAGPLGGFAAAALGPRLLGEPRTVDAHRQEAPEAVLLELEHDAWRGDLGLTALRVLYLDHAAGELRGEDTFFPPYPRPEDRQLVDYAVRFHLAPDVRASVAADGRSVLLRAGGDPGWWLRNDAGEASVEPSGAGEQVVLRGRFHAGQGGRARWKLTQA